MNLLNFCKTYSDFGFDNQALFAWDYSASLGMTPYKEFFYPYGVLSYFVTQNILIDVLFLLITPILLVILFTLFKKLWKSKIYAYFFLVLSVVFINKYIGWEGFDRYGVFVVFSLAFGYLVYTRKSLSKKFSIFFGIIGGFIFSLMHDQGMYIFSVFLFNLFFYSILFKKPFAFLQLASYLTGVFLGLIPFFLYLAKNNAIDGFYNFFVKIKDISLYAKTSFTPYASSPENIFTFLILFSAIFYLSLRFVFKKRITLTNYLQINLCFVIILLEQKSLIRSIDRIIIFPSFVLLILLFSDLMEPLKFHKLPKLKGIFFFCFLLLFVMFLLGVQSYNNNFKINYLMKNDQCINQNLNNLFKKNSVYLKVKNIIKENFKYQGKIFSFSGDPVFYAIFKQIPPYYSNNYDSSPLYAQKKQIDYIKSNNIRYVIYNLDIPSIMDNVPNYIRTSDEFSYIINNFQIVDKVDNFLILEKNIGADIFAEYNFNKYASFAKYLLDVDFQSIPRSEGKYKKKILQSDKVKIIGEFKSITELNSFLRNNNIFSKDKFLVFTPEETGRQDIVIDISSTDGIKTSVRFKPCNKFELCIINLSKAPLFYKERKILKITPKSNISGKFSIIENLTGSNLW